MGLHPSETLRILNYWPPDDTLTDMCVMHRRMPPNRHRAQYSAMTARCHTSDFSPAGQKSCHPPVDALTFFYSLIDFSHPHRVICNAITAT